MAIVEGGKQAITHYSLITQGHFPSTGRAGKVSLIECSLETGRTHQIRVHLSSIGHNIVGDQVYAKNGHNSPTWNKRLNRLDHQLLHAYELGFIHPNGEKMHFKIPPPRNFIDLLNKAGIKNW